MSSPDLQRQPPHNFEAEQALLGAILMSNRSLERVSEFLRPEHFADGLHGRIYEACLTLTGRNQIANPVTLKTYLAQDERLKEQGGDEYLVRLAGAAVSIINTEDYGRLIFDLALRRELIGVGEDIVNDAFEPNMEVDALQQIERAEQTLATLAQSGRADPGARPAAEILPAMLAASRAAATHGGNGILTGLADLDDALGGMSPGHLLVLGARPAMGKSAISCCIARHVAAIAGPVAFFSLEMTAEEIGQRLTADYSGVPVDVIRKGTATDENWHHLQAAMEAISKLPLHIDATPALTVEQIRARARRLHRRQGLRLIVIDHFSLIALPGSRSRLDGLTQASASLKQLAKELGIPLLLLCQLNRGVEQRDVKRPHLADLRESGSIEQDADVAMLLYREHYYLVNSEPQRSQAKSDADYWSGMADWRDNCRAEEHRAQILIAKNRHGTAGTVNLWCDLATSRFRSLTVSQSDEL